MELEPEEGHITVYGTADLSTSAFTEFGVKNLQSLIEEHKRQMAQAAQRLKIKWTYWLQRRAATQAAVLTEWLRLHSANP